MSASTGLELARAVADAVLYEGYLLYPYRATSRKNQIRWQFGVLGPPTAAASGIGEEASMEAECLLRSPDPSNPRDQSALNPAGLDPAGLNPAGNPAGLNQAGVSVHLRFLQLQARSVERLDPDNPSGYVAVDELDLDGQRLLSWEEAVEHEVTLPPYRLVDASPGLTVPVQIPGGEETTPVSRDDGSLVGRVVRRRWPLQAEVTLAAVSIDDFVRLSILVANTRTEPVDSPADAIRGSLIGAHLLLKADNTEFISMLEPPPEAAAAVATCRQRRCWPVLAGSAPDADLVLASPIILYDYPEVAEQSAGALFDSTEIDEILTLRVMTLTDREKAEARATDPRAGEIIDRCEAMTPEALQQLHGILRDPHEAFGHPPEDVPWWDPAADAHAQPGLDAVMISGVRVAKGSRVRVHPTRRADAQDLFFADQEARVTAVLSDVDGEVHVAVVLTDDPAAELHDWYGRYLYFAPDELEPLPDHVTPSQVTPDGATPDPSGLDLEKESRS
ncbi:MAG: hypothetical protein QOF52_309 [Propionibacteriaceae bacterium]|jgi:hypothetical protein|nr:hypothetical protein [Propionibacteriaceae bacterium]